MTDDSKLLTEADDGILLIRINRPRARNAFDLETAQLMEAALDRLDTDPALRVGLISGDHQVFSAGQDLKAAAAGEGALTERRGGFGIMQRPAAKPLIAAVEGPALAGGFELALCCDLIVASRLAVFGLPEVSHGLVAVGGALLRLPRRLPYHLAMEMILTGAAVPAPALERLGLVNRLTEPGEALAEGRKLALQIAANGPLAVTASKTIAVRALEECWTSAEGWREQQRIAQPALDSEDAREGMLAFAEKRRPVWRGR